MIKNCLYCTMTTAGEHEYNCPNRIHTVEVGNTQPYDKSRVGWICPKCERVLAPWMSTCNCPPKIKIGISNASQWQKFNPLDIAMPYRFSDLMPEEAELLADNLLSREEEPEDAILVASGVLQRLVDRALQEPPSPAWERELEEIE